MTPPRAVALFDMDGVLVDTARSYHDAIRHAVRAYLLSVEGLCSLADPEPGAEADLRGVPEAELVPDDVVHGLKRAGGFNNDWDATRALLWAVLRRLPQPVRPGTPVAAALHGADLPAFVAELAAGGGGPGRAAELAGPAAVARTRGRGPVLAGNEVERIFQELYLGAEGFSATYGAPARLGVRPGLLAAETPIANPAWLRGLAGRAALGIATGRPAAEARLALQAQGTEDCFTAVVTLDDVRRAERVRGDGARLSKPHPFSVLEALATLARAGGLSPAVPVVYCGDLPDDVYAAQAAARFAARPITTVGVAADAAAAQALRDAGAERVVRGGTELAAAVEAALGFV